MAHRQTSAIAYNSGTTVVPSISASVQGNLIVVCIAYVQSAGSPTISSVTDSAGNTYALVDSQANTNGNVICDFWMGVQTTGGSTTITVTFSSAPSYAECFVAEFSEIDGSDNASAIDVSAKANGSSTTPSVSLSPTANGKLIIGMTAVNGNSTITAGAGFTSFHGTNAWGKGVYKLVGTTSETPGGTFSFSGSWGIVAASFDILPAKLPSPVIVRQAANRASRY